MKTKGWLAVVALVTALIGVGCGGNPVCGDFPLDEDTRHCVVSTIDTMVQETFPFAEYKGVDLNEFSDALWGTLGHNNDDDVFLGEVARAVSMLQDGHTRMEFRALNSPAVAPIEVERIGEDFVIVAVEDRELAYLRGEKIRAVDGVAIEQVIERTRGFVETGQNGEFRLTGTQMMLAGEAGTALELSLESGLTVSLLRRTLFAEPQFERIGNYGYLKLDTFGFIDDLERIDEAINELMDTEALIIDLRGNGGGFPSVTDGLFGRLIDEAVPDFELVGRDGELHRELRARPRGKTYTGEVVVLTDRRTYSASNYLAHRMLIHERGVLIGSQTGGGAASPQRGEMILPGVWFQVSTHVLMPPAGDHSESGLKPTIPVEPGEAVLGEREGEDQNERPQAVSQDPVLNRAVQYLEGLQ